MWNGELREGGNTLCPTAVTFGHFSCGVLVSPVILSGVCGSLCEPYAESKDPMKFGGARGLAGGSLSTHPD